MKNKISTLTPVDERLRMLKYGWLLLLWQLLERDTHAHSKKLQLKYDINYEMKISRHPMFSE